MSDTTTPDPIRSLQDALNRLPRRSVVLTPPDLAGKVSEAIEALPWTIPAPEVIISPHVRPGEVLIMHSIPDLPIPTHHQPTNHQEDR